MIYVTIRTFHSGLCSLQTSLKGKLVFLTHEAAVKNSERVRGFGNVVATHSFANLVEAQGYVARRNVAVIEERKRAEALPESFLDALKESGL